MIDKISLSGRTAIVTGAGRGFGEQISVDLAALGARVGVLDVDSEAGNACAESIRNSGGAAVSVAADVASRDEVERAFVEVRKTFGDPDILVNNAGIVSMTPFLETSVAVWDRVLAVDYTGPFICSQVAVPAMIERGYGRIVNISSVAGKRGGGFLGTSAYATAKAGLLGFTKALARELAPHGITVNAVAPGAVDTEMTKVLRTDHERLAQILSVIPTGRRGEIQDIADVVAFLASDLSSYMTGETINVDGGLLME